MKPLFLTLALAGCATMPTPSAVPADAFFAALGEHCGNRYAGRLVSEDPADADFAGQEMVVHVAQCSANEIRMPFRVGTDSSRTWIVTRTPDGLRLKHQHLHEDGTPDAVTFYGGTAQQAGTAARQEFPVDDYSIALFRREGLDASVTNVWAFEASDDLIAYELRRPSGRFFRVEFDADAPLAD